MRKLVLRWVILAFSVIVTSIVSQALGLGFRADVSSFASVAQLFVGVAALSLLNATIGRVLKWVTFPITCLTLGLFSLVVNAGVLMIAASLHLGFYIEGGSLLKGFLAAFLASIMIAVVSGIVGVFLPEDKEED